MAYQIKNPDVDYEVPGSLDPDILWNHLLKFKYKGTLTLKNFENGLPCESWDAMYHTGIFLAVSSLRYNRIKDEKILPEIEEVLDTILEQGINFRGFNSPGEYWRDYLLRKYYPTWGKEEVFRDTSRDQVLSMNFGLYFVYRILKNFHDDENVRRIVRKAASIVHEARIFLESHEYHLGTTYGDCRTYRIPFSLLFRMIERGVVSILKEYNESLEAVGQNGELLTDDIRLSRSRRSEIYFKLLGYIQPIIWSIPSIHRAQYFSLDLSMIASFLILNCFDEGNDGTYSEKVRINTRKTMERLLKFMKNDKNLFFEMLYVYSTGDRLPWFAENPKEELDRIFLKFDLNEPKRQDFIWQRHPEFRYRPREDWKGFYAPYHDYLIVYELLNYLGQI